MNSNAILVIQVDGNTCRHIKEAKETAGNGSEVVVYYRLSNGRTVDMFSAKVNGSGPEAVIDDLVLKCGASASQRVCRKAARSLPKEEYGPRGLAW